MPISSNRGMELMMTIQFIPSKMTKDILDNVDPLYLETALNYAVQLLASDPLYQNFFSATNSPRKEELVIPKLPVTNSPTEVNSGETESVKTEVPSEKSKTTWDGFF